MATVQLLSHPASSSPMSKCTMPSSDAQVAYTASSPDATGYFAFARIKGEVFLVQVSSATPASALTTVDIKLFRHEFISIFRFAENRTLHPADISIVEPIDERLTRYEEENETVFLARGLMERMRKLTDHRRMMMSGGGMGRMGSVRQRMYQTQRSQRQR